ncbi:hypothetical protein NPIL_98381 [Nephila pilipes]|uniref:Uncharacterized protein n=1 Tax=Nephila pilipes TaxID=299642 RepID=A0A8X6T917_NEPPI|nr:hypothetical protein NPIL_98381 [Nephila pilipes]
MKSTATRDQKPPKFGSAGALRERRASQARKVLESLLPNTRSRAAEVFESQSAPRTTSIAAPKRFTKSTPNVNEAFIGTDINGNPSPTDDPIEHRGSSDYPSSHLPQHALSCATHRSVTLTCTASTGFIAAFKRTTSLPRNQNEALHHPVGSTTRNKGGVNPVVQLVLASLDAEKSAIVQQAFIKVIYVNSLLLMLREIGKVSRVELQILYMEYFPDLNNFLKKSFAFETPKISCNSKELEWRGHNESSGPICSPIIW